MFLDLTISFHCIYPQHSISYLSHQDLTNSSLQFTQLLSGSGWLVRNGVSYIAKSAVIEGLDSNFVTEKAPRTCIGNFPNGTLAIFEVDGEEDIKTGVGLAEFAEILVILGVSNAINLDGGGSSTVYYNGTVIDLPTCNDTPIICEREVTTITCVKSSL